MIEINNYMKNDQPFWTIHTDDACIFVALQRGLEKMIELNECIIKSELETDKNYKNKLKEKVKE